MERREERREEEGRGDEGRGEEGEEGLVFHSCVCSVTKRGLSGSRGLKYSHLKLLKSL